MINFHPHSVVKEYSHLGLFHPHHVVLSNGEREVLWWSRPHRKGQPVSFEGKRKARKLTWLKVWDVSWWTAFLFVVGSACWVANGIFAFHGPIKDEKQLIEADVATAFCGGTLFYFGGWAMYWEALNIEQTADFSVEVRKETNKFCKALTALICCCHQSPQTTYDASDTWRWIGWDSLQHINFSANFSQFLGTSVFWISVISRLIFYLDSLKEDEHRDLYIGLFWVPQVVGASFLVISSYLLTIETQKHVCTPEPMKLDWHVGMWNLLGSIGFLLSGLFGIVYGQKQMVARLWAVSFTSYLGSCFFLIGSLAQYYEAIRN
jgi:hypothetical protein